MADKDAAPPVAVAVVGKEPAGTLDEQTLAKIIEGVTAKMKEVQRVGGAAGTTPGTSAPTDGKFTAYSQLSPAPNSTKLRV